MKKFRFLKFVGIGILAIGMCFLFIFITMSLWNWLVPALFHGPVLTYWQTAGIFILSKILLTGVAPSGYGRKYDKDWHKKYREKYESRCRPESNEPSAQQV